jgi:capsular polysaccharide transport system permease protein
MAASTWTRLRDGWRIQTRVIHALIIRELHTRFGRENIGFLWIVAEPLLFAGLVGIMYRFLKGPEEHGVSVMAFIATGYIPITLFRHSVARCTAVFVANGSLLYHRQVKILDFIVSRLIIEVLGAMIAYLFIASLLMAFGEFPVPSNMGLFMAGWALYVLFTWSLCLVIAPLSEMSEVLEKFLPIITYVMIPFSGLFTMASWLAPSMRRYLLWSPFVNGMELMRKGIWGDKLVAYWNIWNPLGCSLVLAVIGLALCRHIRKKLAIE